MLGFVLQNLEGPSLDSIQYAKDGWELTLHSDKYPRRVAHSAIHTAMCSIFYAPLSECMKFFDRAYQFSNLCNDRSYIGFSALFLGWMQSMLSYRLQLVIASISPLLLNITKQNIEFIRIGLQATYDCAHMLSTNNPTPSLPEDIPRLNVHQRLEDKNLTALLLCAWIDYVRAYYILGDNRNLLMALTKLEKHIEQVSGMLPYIEFPFLDSLAKIRLFSAENQTLEELLIIVDGHLKKLTHYSSMMPVNFRGKLILVQAERYRISHSATLKSHLSDALALYDQAIEISANDDQFHVAAIAAELAMKLCLDVSMKVASKAYNDMAISFYNSWGAKTKADSLSNTKLARSWNFSKPHSSIDSKSIHLSAPDASSSPSNIVLNEATQILSGEGNPQKVVKVICSVCFEKN
jgi:hypothetical protein